MSEERKKDLVGLNIIAGGGGVGMHVAVPHGGV